MFNNFFVLTSVCAATLAVTACGGGSGTVPVTAAPPAATAPATPSTAVVTTPPLTTPAVTAPVTTAPITSPVTAAPVTTAPVSPPVTTPVTTAPTAPTASGAVTTLTGSAVKGPVGNATVTAKKPDGTACGTTATNASGQYNFTTSCTGDVIIEVTGGSYLDEATNVTKALDTPLKSVISATGGTVNGVITPLTTMAFSYAFSSNSAASKAAFDAQAVKIANQFGLTGINIGTTVPVVSGNADAYGNALKGISQYLKDNPAQTLAAVTTASLKSSPDFVNFGNFYSAAYNKINNTNIKLTFDGAAFNFTGTGAGGGSGTCGISQKGTLTTAGITVPISFDYCVSGIAGASCDVGNQALSQSLSAQSAAFAGVNVVTTYGPTCAAGAISIVLK